MHEGGQQFSVHLFDSICLCKRSDLCRHGLMTILTVKFLQVLVNRHHSSNDGTKPNNFTWRILCLTDPDLVGYIPNYPNSRST